MNLQGKSLLSLKDFSTEEIRYLLELSKNLKAKMHAKEEYTPLKGYSMAMIFQKDLQELV